MSHIRWITLALCLMLFGGLGWALRPTIVQVPPGPSIGDRLPEKVGAWRLAFNTLDQIAASSANLSLEQPYDEVASRVYADPSGGSMMVTLAYGRNQRQEIKIHRPELCYPAQGFQVKSLENIEFPHVHSLTSAEAITGKRMVTSGGDFDEIVSYWIRIGDTYSDSAIKTRLTILREGLKGRMTDGILVRVSQRVPPNTDPGESFRAQQEFLSQFVAAMDPSMKTLLVR